MLSAPPLPTPFAPLTPLRKGPPPRNLGDLLEIEYPIVQAPIGSATTPELAAAVSNAGGLGHLAVTWRDLEETRDVIRETHVLTAQPSAVNSVYDDARFLVRSREEIDRSRWREKAVGRRDLVRITGCSSAPSRLF